MEGVTLSIDCIKPLFARDTEFFETSFLIWQYSHTLQPSFWVLCKSVNNIPVLGLVCVEFQ